MAKENKVPSAPRAVKTPAPNEEMVDQQIEELFTKKASVGEEPRHDQFENFIRATAHSKIAVVMPMYGYWMDIEWPEDDAILRLDEEMLKLVVNRVSSSAHKLYAIVVAEPERMSPNVYETLSGRYVGGNVRGVRVPVGSSYSDYVAEGLRIALEETDAQYIVLYSPWGILQSHGIDNMIDRVNLNGNAPAIVGYNLFPEVGLGQFDAHKAGAPREFAAHRAKHLLSFNFLGMRRFLAEMCHPDPRFKTKPFVERDFFQQISQKGFDAVTSERVPVFFPDIKWSLIVPDEWYEEDAEAFVKKWSFSPVDLSL